MRQNVPTPTADVLPEMVFWGIAQRVSFGIVMRRLVVTHVLLMVGIVANLNKISTIRIQLGPRHMYIFFKKLMIVM